MCGIVGIFRGQGASSSGTAADMAGRMANAIQHRGPDDHGVWANTQGSLAFGHRRLSVIDLSPLGHQPMQSSSGRFVITYNGEIYNYLDLKRELITLGRQFRSTSDTEVLLEAAEVWGIQETLQRAEGMFALGIWDNAERRLTLARDRLGEKPLYYGWNSGNFLFASELKALRACPEFRPQLSLRALGGFLRFGYIPQPDSIYQGIYKIPPGCSLSLSEGACSQEPTQFNPNTDSSNRSQSVSLLPYWTLAETIEKRLPSPNLTIEEAASELDRRLLSAVQRQMIADVPVGAFLSGGVDSSLICALMQKCSSRPVHTFSIGFLESEYNEAEAAAQIAAHLGTQHHELYVTPASAREVIPLLPQIYDEPFGDVSAIPTYLVAKLAREKVTVSLSGDGGDELFGGYARYASTERLWSWLSATPWVIRRLIGAVSDALPEQRWQKIYDFLEPCIPRNFRATHFGSKFSRIASVLPAKSLDQAYGRVLAHHLNPYELVRGLDSEENCELRTDIPDGLIAAERLMYLDSLEYLPGDILTKLDRASMAVSLESRVPLLDRQIVEFAWALPPRLRAPQVPQKALLKSALSRYVPQQLFDRPKSGFGVPIGDWLRKDLRPWAEDLLDPKILTSQGLLDAGEVEKVATRVWKGERSPQYLLWHILMFQAWWRANGG